jgi:hypothetical protein
MTVIRMKNRARTTYSKVLLKGALEIFLVLCSNRRASGTYRCIEKAQ